MFWLMTLVLYAFGMVITFTLQQDVAERQARPWLSIDSLIVLIWPVELVWWAWRVLRERLED